MLAKEKHSSLLFLIVHDKEKVQWPWHLVLPGHLGHDCVDGDGEDHDGHPGEDGSVQLLVHEVAAEGNL